MNGYDDDDDVVFFINAQAINSFFKFCNVLFKKTVKLLQFKKIVKILLHRIVIILVLAYSKSKPA